MSSEYSDDDYDDVDGHSGEISSAEEFRLVKISSAGAAKWDEACATCANKGGGYCVKLCRAGGRDSLTLTSDVRREGDASRPCTAAHQPCGRRCVCRMA